MSSVTTDVFRGRVEDHLVVFTLDRPKANAIDDATSRVMGNAFVSFRDEPDLRVAVITGAGDRIFSAGWDLKAASQGLSEDADYGVGGFAGLEVLAECNKRSRRPGSIASLPMRECSSPRTTPKGPGRSSRSESPPGRVADLAYPSVTL